MSNRCCAPVNTRCVAASSTCSRWALRCPTGWTSSTTNWTACAPSTPTPSAACIRSRPSSCCPAASSRWTKRHARPSGVAGASASTAIPRVWRCIVTSATASPPAASNTTCRCSSTRPPPSSTTCPKTPRSSCMATCRASCRLSVPMPASASTSSGVTPNARRSRRMNSFSRPSSSSCAARPLRASRCPPSRPMRGASQQPLQRGATRKPSSARLQRLHRMTSALMLLRPAMTHRRTPQAANPLNPGSTAGAHAPSMPSPCPMWPSTAAKTTPSVPCATCWMPPRPWSAPPRSA